ncbi:MAG: hypothetical protein KDC79_17270 [Cyclobacteriaceae bacterium]|nr:hypothetical protein [Cyclobacteriaceae bacterium]
MQIIAENKQAVFKYDPNRKLLLSTYKGIFNYDLAKESYNQIEGVEVVGKIADVRKLNGSFMKLMSEFREKYPILKKQGLAAEAFVISDDLMINNLVEKLRAQLKSIGIETYACQTIEEAESWIQTYLSLENIE